MPNRDAPPVLLHPGFFPQLIAKTDPSTHPFPVHVARIGLSHEGTPRWRWWVGPYFWKAGALAVVLAAALAPASAYACQCKVSGVREAIDRAESVFIARPREAGPEGLMLVDVVRAFKGRITAGTQTVVATESKSDCPLPMAFVDEHGVLVSKEPVLFYGSADQEGRVAHDSCGRTRPISKAKEDLRHLSAATPALDSTRPDHRRISTVEPSPAAPKRHGCSVDPNASGRGSITGLWLCVFALVGRSRGSARRLGLKVLLGATVVALNVGCTTKPPAPAPSTTRAVESTPTVTPKPSTEPAWTTLPNLAEGRHEASLSTLSDGGLLIVGGTDGEGGLFETAAWLRPGADRWEAVALLGGRRRHAATGLPDGRVLISGGLGVDATGWSQELLSTTEIFDPSTGHFTAGPPMIRGRVDHLGVVSLDGDLWIVGGTDTYTATGETEILPANQHGFVSGPTLESSAVSGAWPSDHGIVAFWGGRRRLRGLAGRYSRWANAGTERLPPAFAHGSVEGLRKMEAALPPSGGVLAVRVSDSVLVLAQTLDEEPSWRAFRFDPVDEVFEQINPPAPDVTQLAMVAPRTVVAVGDSGTYWLDRDDWRSLPSPPAELYDYRIATAEGRIILATGLERVPSGAQPSSRVLELVLPDRR